MSNIKIISINESQWEKIYFENSFSILDSLDIKKGQKIVFALNDHLYGYFNIYQSGSLKYYIKATQLFKVYCYNLKEELNENEEKVKSLFIFRTSERKGLRLKIIVKKNFFQYLWSPGNNSLISQAEIEIDSHWSSALKIFPDFGNKKQMFHWYQSLLPSSLISDLKKYQSIVIEFNNLEQKTIKLPFPFFFDGEEYLGANIMFIFSNIYRIKEKEKYLSLNPQSLSLMGNFYKADDSMEKEVNHLYKYFSVFYKSKQIEYFAGNIRREDFLFALQQVEHLHYSGHATKEGLYLSDGIIKANNWLSLKSLPKIMVFSCCEFLTTELALKLIQKGVVTILTFEGTVISEKVNAFVKDMYWQWMTASLPLIEAAHVTFKKHLNQSEIRFYPKIYGEGWVNIPRNEDPPFL